MSEELDWLCEDLRKRAEWWRTIKEDPHNIGTAVYTALCEMTNAVNGAREVGKNEETQHAGDCTIYRALINGRPEDGVCTCGYGWSLVRKGDRSEMYSLERLHHNEEKP